MKCKKKYLSFFLVIMILFGLAYNPGFYVAAEEYSFETLEKEFNSFYDSAYYGYVTFDQVNYLVLEANGTVCCFVGGSVVYDTSTSYGFNVRVNGFQAGESGIRGAQIWRWEDGSWVNIASKSSPAYCTVGATSNFTYFKFSDYLEWDALIAADGPRVLACSQEVLDPEGNIYIAVCDFGWDEVFNPGLGYLTGLSYKKLLLVDSNGDVLQGDAKDVRYLFEYDALTSTGNVLDSSYIVRHYMDIEVHEGVDVGECNIIRANGRIWMEDYNAADGRIEYGKDYLANFHESSGFEGLNWWESNFYHTEVVHYFQLVKLHDNGVREYGNLLKFTVSSKNAIAIAPGGEVLPDYSEDVDVGSGSGINFDDAEINADNDKPLYDFGDYDSNGIVDDLMSILSFIGAFPSVIGVLLNWLPAEYRTLVYVSIGAVVVILVVRVARG